MQPNRPPTTPPSATGYSPFVPTQQPALVAPPAKTRPVSGFHPVAPPAPVTTGFGRQAPAVPQARNPSGFYQVPKPQAAPPPLPKHKTGVHPATEVSPAIADTAFTPTAVPLHKKSVDLTREPSWRQVPPDTREERVRQLGIKALIIAVLLTLGYVGGYVIIQISGFNINV